MINEWDLQSRGIICSQCQRTFADRQTYHTFLSYDTAGYRRQDLCVACWPSAPRTGEISHWQSTFFVPPPPPPEPVKKETAESLLRKLLDSDDSSQISARYILAVMLERKRLLKPRETTASASGQKLLVYEHAKTGESFLIADPGLRLDQLDEVQKQIIALLGAPNSAPNPAPANSETPSS